jgi:CRP-like cAMP-binding protein
MQTARKVPAVKSAKTSSALDSLLKNVIEGKDLLKLQNGMKLFSQGEEGDAIYFIASSVKFVGEFRFWQLAEDVIESQFSDSKGPETVRFSHRDFCFVV